MARGHKLTDSISISELMHMREVEGLSNGEIARKLMDSNSFYTPYIIPAGTYAGQDTDIVTVTVKATLIVSASASEEDVYNITKAIFDNAAAIATP